MSVYKKKKESLAYGRGRVLYLQYGENLGGDVARKLFGHDPLQAFCGFVEQNRHNTLFIISGRKKELGELLTRSSCLASLAGNSVVLDFALFDYRDLEEVFYASIRELGLEMSKRARRAAEQLLRFSHAQRTVCKKN